MTLCRPFKERRPPGAPGAHRGACALSLRPSGPAPVLPARWGLHGTSGALCFPPPRHGAGRSGGKPTGCSQARPYQHPQALPSNPSLRSCSPPPVPNDSLIPPSPPWWSSFSSSPPDICLRHPASIPPDHHAHLEPPAWPEQPWGSGLSPAASSLLICSDGHTVPHI